MTFVGNFLNFHVKERFLYCLDYLLEILPIFEASCCSIVVERTTACIRPPLLGMFVNSRFLGVFCPSLINDRSELVDYAFQFFHVANVRYVQVFEVQNDFFNKGCFLVTLWRNQKF